MSVRRIGFYRVKRGGKWTVGEWTSIGYWYICGVNHGFDGDEYFEDIDEDMIPLEAPHA